MTIVKISVVYFGYLPLPRIMKYRMKYYYQPNCCPRQIMHVWYQNFQVNLKKITCQCVVSSCTTNRQVAHGVMAGIISNGALTKAVNASNVKTAGVLLRNTPARG